jgi:hypothetical protein
MTVKQGAALMSVSERMVYMCKRVMRMRPDLGDAMTRGELSAHAALKIATGRNSQPDRYDALIRAFNRCSADEKARFLVSLGRLIGWGPRA